MGSKMKVIETINLTRSSSLYAHFLRVGVLLLASLTSIAKADNDLSYVAVTDGYWQVWTSDINGNNAHQITRSSIDKINVGWFPDGKSMLVNLNDGRVERVDVATGNETLLVLERSPVLDARVSPNGKKIAFSFSTAIDGNDLWLADIDGKNAERMFRMAGLQHEPIWSANGEFIYFLSGEGKQSHDIWRINVSNRSTEQLTVGELYHFDIALAAGSRMSYSSNRTGNYEIYLENPDKPAVQLTNDPALDARPTFAPDGNSIIFESSRGGAMNLWRIDLITNRLEQITHTKLGARAPACRIKKGSNNA